MEKKFWNYRIVEEEREGDVFYSVKEVYYNEEGKVFAWSKTATDVVFEYGEDYLELIKQLLEAKEKTILKEVDGEMIDTYDFIDDLKEE